MSLATEGALYRALPTALAGAVPKAVTPSSELFSAGGGVLVFRLLGFRDVVSGRVVVWRAG